MKRKIKYSTFTPSINSYVARSIFLKPYHSKIIFSTF